MSRRRLIRNEQGQTMVEFALVVPILCLILFGVLQFGALYNDYVTLTDASRVGARKATVSKYEDSPEAAAEAAARNSAKGLDPGQLDIDVLIGTTGWERGQSVTVVATYPYEIDLLGVVVASGELTSETTERVE
jgi:Flp pilus assembly protein TadG